jgi:hypothetical protein
MRGLLAIYTNITVVVEYTQLHAQFNQKIQTIHTICHAYLCLTAIYTKLQRKQQSVLM